MLPLEIDCEKSIVIQYYENPKQILKDLWSIIY
jgi:hypothetical protein